MSTANAKTVIRFVTSLTEGIAAGLEDGRFQLNDALALLPAVVELPVAVTAAQNIDLGTLSDENLEARIEDALSLAAAIGVYVKTWTDGQA
jgi:hypothetical protein